MRGINSKQKRKIKERLFHHQDAKCWVCGTRRSIRTFTIDHVLPKRLGGRANRKNLRLACFECNQKRGAAVSRLLDRDYYTNHLGGLNENTN